MISEYSKHFHQIIKYCYGKIFGGYGMPIKVRTSNVFFSISSVAS